MNINMNDNKVKLRLRRLGSLLPVHPSLARSAHPHINPSEIVTVILYRSQYENISQSYMWYRIKFETNNRCNVPFVTNIPPCALKKMIFSPISTLYLAISTQKSHPKFGSQRITFLNNPACLPKYTIVRDRRKNEEERRKITKIVST